MNNQYLFPAVNQLAQQTHAFSEADLEQPWQWRKHDEGVRFALIGAYHELRDLAVKLAAQRAQAGPPLTKAQRALAPYHAAYRDLQAVLIGVTDEMYDREPAPGEWPLRYVLGHMAGAERTFFTLVHYGVERQQDAGKRPSRLPDGEVEKVTGPRQEFVNIMENQGLAEMMAFYDGRHTRALTEFAAITDQELEGPSLWWEDEAYSLQYRLHRFDAHLRQHTIQAEKTLAAIGRSMSEARQLLRLVYQALAEAESQLIGAAELGLADRQAAAAQITEWAESVVTVVQGARAMETAVNEGNLDTIQTLIAKNPRLVNALAQNRLPLILVAQYARKANIVNALEEAGAALSVFEAAALGRLDTVQTEVEEWDGWLNEYGRDGFTPLHLACYFGHTAVAAWLIEKGANIDAAARNAMQIAPIHAAAASGKLSILKALLENGADVNAQQRGGFTPLHTAAAHNNAAMIELFLEHGADSNVVNAEGQAPLDMAQAAGNEAAAALLKTFKGS